MTDHETPTGRELRRPRKSRAQRVREAQRALELHQAGFEDVYICDQLSISRATLYRRIRLALTLVIDPTVTEYRGHALGRIRALRRRTFDTLGKVATDERTLLDPETGDVVLIHSDPAAVVRLVDTLTRLEDQEARLRGAYAPTRVDVTVQQKDAWAALEAELRTATEPPHQPTNEPGPGTERA